MELEEKQIIHAARALLRKVSSGKALPNVLLRKYAPLTHAKTASTHSSNVKHASHLVKASHSSNANAAPRSNITHHIHNYAKAKTARTVENFSPAILDMLISEAQIGGPKMVKPAATVLQMVPSLLSTPESIAAASVAMECAEDIKVGPLFIDIQVNEDGITMFFKNPGKVGDSANDIAELLKKFGECVMLAKPGDTFVEGFVSDVYIFEFFPSEDTLSKFVAEGMDEDEFTLSEEEEEVEERGNPFAKKKGKKDDDEEEDEEDEEEEEPEDEEEEEDDESKDKAEKGKDKGRK